MQHYSDCCNAELHIIKGRMTCLYCGKDWGEAIKFIQEAMAQPEQE